MRLERRSQLYLYDILIIMKGSSKLLCFFLLIFILSSQPAYQERAIYLSPTDNVCHGSASYADQLYLVISTNGSPSKKTEQWGNTMCTSTGFTDAQRISSGSNFSYIDLKLGHNIRITQEQKRNYVDSILHSIVLKATGVQSCTLSRNPCSCRILGDGQVHHYGVDSASSPAQIYLNCTYAKEISEK